MSNHLEHLNRLIKQGDFASAQTLINEMESSQASELDKQLANARYFYALGQHGEAEHWYLQATQENPLSKVDTHSLAVCMRVSGKPAEALKVFEHLERGGVKDFALFHNMANALYDLGRLDEAIKQYQYAIKLNPNYPESHENLNELLWETGRKDELFQSYEGSLLQTPNDLKLVVSYLTLLMRSEDYQRAKTLIDNLSSDLQSDPNIISLRSSILKEQGEVAEARSLFESSFGTVNFNKEQIVDYAQLLILSGDIERAREFLSGLSQVHPQDQLILAHLSYLAGISNQQPALPLTNYQDLVRSYDIEKYLDQPIEKFCQELSDLVIQQHNSEFAPLTQSLREGTQTKGNLFATQHHQVQALQSAFRRCIEEYVKALKQIDEPYPEFSSVDNFEFSGSWSVRLVGKGFHVSHMHPMGWLSSVFYLDVPSISRIQGINQGWLHFGIPDHVKSPLPEQAKKKVQPEVGKLVLFPSYMWHGTFPFESSEQRLTIAFDVAKS